MGQNQHPFEIKFSKLGTEENFNCIKSIYEKPTDNTTLNGGKFEAGKLSEKTKIFFLLRREFIVSVTM